MAADMPRDPRDVAESDLKSLLDQAAGEGAINPDLAVSFFRENPDACLVVDPEGIIKHVNRQAELMTGYHRSELIGQPVDILVPDALRGAHGNHRERFEDDPRSRPMGTPGMALHVRKKGGKEVPVDINLSPVPTVDGRLTIAVLRRRGDLPVGL